MNSSQLLTDLWYLYPELIVTGTALLVLSWDFATRGAVCKNKLAWLSILGLAVAIMSSASLLGQHRMLFGQLMAIDSFAILYKFIALGAAILTIAISMSYLNIEEINYGEYYALILFATAGAMVMSAGTNFLTIYLGVELTAIPTYILCGLSTGSPRSNESALKYYILGVLASAIMAYGVSLVYGVTGSINLHEIKQSLATSPAADYKNIVLIAGMAMLVAGFSFKIAAAPFHMWVPDVYEGAPTSVTAFMSVVPKAAAFGALLRVFAMAISSLKVEWGLLFAVLAALTMIMGNFLALTQESVKRMLAYSGIAHVGYALIGVVASVVSPDIGISSTTLYFLVYFVGQIGAFAVLILLAHKSGLGERYEDFKGLARTNPAAALTMTVFIFSLIGIPPTGGFIAKFWVFASAVRAGFMWLAMLGVMSAVVSCYYYLRVVVLMYMHEPDGQPEPITSPRSLSLALAVMAIITIYMGINPAPFMELAQKTIAAIL